MCCLVVLFRFLTHPRLTLTATVPLRSPLLDLLATSLFSQLTWRQRSIPPRSPSAHTWAHPQLRSLSAPALMVGGASSAFSRGPHSVPWPLLPSLCCGLLKSEILHAVTGPRGRGGKADAKTSWLFCGPSARPARETTGLWSETFP